MNQNIKTSLGVIIILIISATIGIFVWKAMKTSNPAENQIVTQNPKAANLVGNDKDEHGCIGSAGYTWCEDKQKCLRSWEEECVDANGIKTYRNKTYGFEFKYPVDFKIEQPVPDIVIIHISQKQEYLQVQFLNTEPAPAENYAPNGAKLIGEVTIGGKKATRYHTENPLNLEGVLKGYPFTDYTIVLNNNKYVEVNYYGKGSIAESFERILSTFKFTK